MSGKWKLQIVWHLSRHDKIRFNELKRALGSISTRTLTQQLRELEEQKIIVRTIYPEVPPRVEYALSEIGKTISPILESLCTWGKQYQEMLALSE